MKRFTICLAGNRASQIVELAVMAPLLVVFVVGIYDFGEAFNTKEKLNFAAKDAAKFGATQPTNDLSQDFPISVTAMRDLVDSDLISAGLSDCGLSTIQSAGRVTWTAAGTCANGLALTLTIDRGFVVPPAAGANNPIQQISTRVRIQYPYRWRIGTALQAVAPGSAFPAVSVIDTDAVAANQD
jgi:Flp pilus assembly protein TadG